MCGRGHARARVLDVNGTHDLSLNRKHARCMHSISMFHIELDTSTQGLTRPHLTYNLPLYEHVLY